MEVLLISAENEFQSILAKNTTFGKVNEHFINKLIYDEKFFDEEKNKLYKVWEAHRTLMEFVSITFVLTDISRNALDDLARHRHMTLNMQSTRNESLKMDDPNILSDYYKQFFGLKPDWVSLVTKEPIDNLGRDEKNGLLPLGIGSQAIFKTNLRELIYVSGMRMCSHARKEIQNTFIILKSLLQQNNSDYYKYLGAKCEDLGYCPEAKSCGRKVTKEIAKEFLMRLDAVKDDYVHED